MQIRNYLFLLIIITSFFSCSKDEDISFIPSEIQEEVNSFKYEASQRGMNIQFKGLKIILQSTSPHDGHPGAYFPNENTIRIDTTSDFYKFSPSSKEHLIFHELGHAILKRDHRNGFLPNNDCISLMDCCHLAGYANTSPNTFFYKRDVI